ncbi:MAG: type II toxin-antitoxin system PemK/MazF family toxin [Burkholderiales bacterium]|nr:type II toxin-antitoxin system PemK/MazF family toxin [Burkholderiales bacterium]
MVISPGDVVMVDVQFSDQSGHKQRPALVLTAMDANGDFLVVPITTSSNHANGVLLDPGRFAKGGLPRQSWIRADLVYTVNTATFVKQFGTLKAEAVKEVLKVLCPKIGCK